MTLFLSVNGQPTPNFNFLPVHSILQVNSACTNFGTEYLIIIDEIVIKMTVENSRPGEDL